MNIMNKSGERSTQPAADNTNYNISARIAVVLTAAGALLLTALSANAAGATTAAPKFEPPLTGWSPVVIQRCVPYTKWVQDGHEEREEEREFVVGMMDTIDGPKLADPRFLAPDTDRPLVRIDVDDLCRTTRTSYTHSFAGWTAR